MRRPVTVIIARPVDLRSNNSISAYVHYTRYQATEITAFATQLTTTYLSMEVAIKIRFMLILLRENRARRLFVIVTQ